MSRKVLVLTLLVLLSLGACVGARLIYCEQRRTPPKAPIYPGSTLVNQVSSGVGTSGWPILTYDYVSAASPDKIVAFYEEKGTCGQGDNPRQKGRELCRGVASPFGEYFVYIDLNSHLSKGLTSYSLEIRWHGCSDKLE